jgi:hypothetical protein
MRIANGKIERMRKTEKFMVDVRSRQLLVFFRVNGRDIATSLGCLLRREEQEQGVADNTAEPRSM